MMLLDYFFFALLLATLLYSPPMMLIAATRRIHTLFRDMPPPRFAYAAGALFDDTPLPAACLRITLCLR